MNLSPRLIDLIADVIGAGGEAYLVGGSVRDWRMGRASADVDIEVHGLSQSRFESILQMSGAVNRVGAAYPVYLAGGADVSLVDAPDIETALARRDFTMNAMAWDFRTERLIDPFGGRQDILDGVLAMTGEGVFVEDPVRVLRGMRFASQFDLFVPGPTVAAMARAFPVASKMAVEREWAEWEKWARTSKPSRGLLLLQATGWLARYPELAALDGLMQDPDWHPEGDAWQHTMYVVDAAAEFSGGDPVLVMAALLHDVGKPSCTRLREDGRIVSPGHAQAGVGPARDFLNRLLAPKRFYEALGYVQEHMVRRQRGKKVTPRMVRRLASRLAEYDATIERLAVVMHADRAGRPPLPPEQSESMLAILAVAAELEVGEKGPEPLVMGRDLIAAGLVEPGPEVGRLLAEAYEAQLDGEFDSTEGGVAFVKNLQERG